MKTSQKGIELIKQFEGCRLKAYKPVPTEKYYTIGYGHYGADVAPAMTITKEYAEKMLKSDLLKYEMYVNNLGREWTQNEFDALVSFVYNCGQANLKTLVSNRNKTQIADALLLYTKAGGNTLNGLVRRRKAERTLFLDNDIITQLAHEVIDGLWGNGAARKNKLTEAGYDYNAVQRMVNKILTGDK